MAYKVVTYDGKMIGNQGGLLMVEYDPLNPLKLPEKTVRVRMETGYRPYAKSGTVKPVEGQPDVYDVQASSWSRLFEDSSNYSPNNHMIEVLGANGTGITSMSSMFKYTSVKRVALFDTSSVQNCTDMFYYCRQLESIPAFDLSKCTSFNNMFNSCESLEEIPETLDLSSATTANWMFYNCTSMKHAPRLLNTGKLQYTEYMFGACSSLEDIVLFDTSSVTTAGRMFRGCEKLASMPAFNFSKVKSFYEMFSYCELITDLSQLILGDNISSVDYMFYKCKSLTELPEMDISKCSALYHTFDGCESLTHIDKDLIPANTVYADGAFNDCKNLDNALELYNKLLTCPVDEESHEDTFKNAGIDAEGGLEQLLRIPYDWGGLFANIYIDFKFSDPDYDPSAHQLGVGKAVTGEDKYNQANKNFSAEWIKDTSSEDNVWRWSVTEGSDISNAFVYGDGTSTGTPMLSNDTIISGIPAKLTTLEGGTIESLKAQAETWLVGHEIDPEDYVPNCEIVGWDISHATSMTSFIGTNYWYNNCLTGTIPELKSDTLGNISYAFDRCWNVTSAGKIEIPECTSAQNAYYSMLGLTSLPCVMKFGGQDVQNMFRGCVSASKSSIEQSYFCLYDIWPSRHSNCFKLCGIYEDASALDNIPQGWGGNLADGTVIPIGSVLLSNNLVDYVHGDMLDLTDQFEVDNPTEPGEDEMAYFDINGVKYYNKAAVEYIRSNLSTLYPGYHLPTVAESREIGDVIFYNPYDESDEWSERNASNWEEILNVFNNRNIGLIEPYDDTPHYAFYRCYNNYWITDNGQISATEIDTLYWGYSVNYGWIEFGAIYLVKDN